MYLNQIINFFNKKYFKKQTIINLKIYFTLFITKTFIKIAISIKIKSSRKKFF